MGVSVLLVFVVGLLATRGASAARCDQYEKKSQEYKDCIADGGRRSPPATGVTGTFDHNGALSTSSGDDTRGGGSGGGLIGGGSSSSSSSSSGSFSRGSGGTSGGGSHLTLGGGDDDRDERGDRGRGCRWGLDGKKDCGGGKGDPILTGFTGRSFNFLGEVGKTYNLISSKNHQMSAKLKLAPMWNHNGTNMEGIAMMYKTYKVLMELEGDDVKVYLQEKVLPAKKHVQKHAWRFEDGTAVEMEWDMYKPGIGNTVTVTTEVMKVMMWHTPKGLIDEGGKELEGYLNFNITLISAPEGNVMSGVIGDTYERFTVGQQAFSPNSTYYLPEDGAWHGKGPLEAYEMANYWDTKFKMNTFGLSIVEMRERSSLEVVPLVDLPAFASFTLTQETSTAQKATSSSMRRLLNV